MKNKTQKKILQLVSTTGFAGVERFIVDLSKFLLNTQFQPIIGIIKNAHNPNDELENIAKSENLQTNVFECHGRFDRKLKSKLREYLINNDIALLHSHQYKANFFTLWATKNLGIARITTCHLYDDMNYDFKIKFYSWLDKKLLHKFDHVVTTSERIKSAILKYNVDESKTKVIDNGIDITRFENPIEKDAIRKSLGLKHDLKVIGTVGRLCTQKNQILLLQSASRIIQINSNIIIIIIGDGQLRSELEKQAQKLKIADKVLFMGSRKDIPELLSVMDIFVLPSLDEGLPLALLEAMSAKLPVIVTPVGSIPNVVKHNENGIIIENKVSSLENALHVLLADPAKAQVLAQNGYETVVNQFTNEKMAEKYLEVYEEVITNFKLSNFAS